MGQPGMKGNKTGFNAKANEEYEKKQQGCLMACRQAIGAYGFKIKRTRGGINPDETQGEQDNADVRLDQVIDTCFEGFHAGMFKDNQCKGCYGHDFRQRRICIKSRKPTA